MIGMDAVAANMQMWVTFAVIAAGIVSFTLERMPLELTAAGIVTALVLVFTLAPLPADTPDAATLLAGFAHPALFTIMSLLVIGQGLYHTGALERSARAMGALVHKARHIGHAAALAVPFLIAGIISGFLNNTPVVVIFIPVLTAIAARVGESAGRVLMPLSFIAILGGMTTLIGSSPNLIVASVAAKAGGPITGFFDFAIPGAFLASLGALYVLFVMPRFLKHRTGAQQSAETDSGRQFASALTLGRNHPWIGEQARAGLFPALKTLTIWHVRRKGEIILPPFEDTVLQPGDALTFSATRKALSNALNAWAPAGLGLLDHDTPALAEAVLAPGSRLIGATLPATAIQANTGCVPLGLQRRRRMPRTRLENIPLQAGDVILLMGTHEAIRGLRSYRDLILLAWSARPLPATRRSRAALGIFLATIAAAATGIVPIVTAAITGALAMVVLGCLNIRQAARAFDRKIYLLVGAAFAMAEALQATGGAAFLAHQVVALFADAGPAVLLSALFLLVAILTNFLSNHATAALFAPIAVGAATEIGADPAPFLYGVIFAVNCCFATPIAYQTNLLVMGPGGYRFRDFLKAGTPLVILIWVAYSLFAPWYFGM